MDGGWDSRVDRNWIKWQRMFESKFSTENGVKGVALGIAGDTVRTILYV